MANSAQRLLSKMKPNAAQNTLEVAILQILAASPGDMATSVNPCVDILNYLSSDSVLGKVHPAHVILGEFLSYPKRMYSQGDWV